ncbi:UNVERIFIED_CONTAM: hypothetical protein GTU68_013619 [Idotea baltica]|nr:hypothetical protein [Idotea baltica]
MTRSVDLFTPADGKTVRMYFCGPTVYSEAHIGNMRAYLFSDLARRTLTLAGWHVDSVMNVTDVEDKMQKSANEQQTTAWDIAERYTELFFTDTELLNVEAPTRVIRATDAIDEQIQLIVDLESKGVTYETSDGVYFDTSKISDYGKLTPSDTRESVLAGNRVDFGEKRNPTDFALWKLSPTDEAKRDMEWESPWGIGFPGWHIECSAMAMAHHGPTLDIHIGGIDHIPIHHTNEIAQSETVTGEEFSRWWMHCAFLTLGDDEKMSKSKGAFLTVRKLEEQGFDALDFRYLVLTSHYRSELAFSIESLTAAATARKRLARRVAELRDEAEPASELPVDDEHWVQFTSALGDDLNSPRAIAAIWGLARESTQDAATKLAILQAADTVLGLDLFATAPAEADAPAELIALAQQRQDSRAAGDYAAADKLRDQIKAAGYDVVDTAQGFTLQPL